MIDHPYLNSQYKSYQRVLHPDKFSASDIDPKLQDNAKQVRSYCSNAYQILLNDITRAQYILKTEHNIEALAEESKEKDPEVMEWVFETRMEIDDADVGPELDAINMQI